MEIKTKAKTIIEIKKKTLARYMFGKYPNWKRSTQEIKDEARNGWE